MKTNINQVEIRMPEDRDEMIRAATSIDETCVSVGGLADNLGMLDTPCIPTAAPSVGPKAVARLVEFWRRSKQLSVTQLAEAARLDEAEVYVAEHGESVPEPRVLYALSEVLEVSYEKLLYLTGHATDRNETLQHEAIRFAARSESMDKLSQEEEAALHDFIRALAE